MDEFVEWYFSDANNAVDKDDKKATKNAYDNGKITLDQLKSGSIWKRNKVNKMKPGQITRLNDDFLGYQAAIAQKKQAEENAKAEKAKAEKAKAEKAKAVNKPQTPKDDSKKQDAASEKQEAASASEDDSEKRDAVSASKDLQTIMETAGNYADVKPTVKVSPFFWKNIDYMLENDKSAAMKEEDSAKKQELLKKLKSQKAELYADHILKSLANLAYSTSNWTGAEAGHNPAHEMTSSQADLYKNIQNQAYANQMSKIKDYDIKQQTDRTDTVNKVFNDYLDRQVASKWKAWSNDSRFKDAKGNIDYIKMFDSLDIDEKQYLNGIMKSKLASLDENSSIEDAAKAFAGYELGPIATEVLKGAVEATGAGIQSAFNWLKDRL